jgi:hypothetical protein
LQAVVAGHLGRRAGRTILTDAEFHACSEHRERDVESRRARPRLESKPSVRVALVASRSDRETRSVRLAARR